MNDETERIYKELLKQYAEAIKQAKKTSDGAKRVRVCPAWDDKTMSCMLDKREILFRKKR